MAKKLTAFVLILLMVFSLYSCGKQDNTDPTESSTESETQKKEEEEMIDIEALKAKTTFSPTVYDVDEIKTAEQTEAGSYAAWQGEVFTQDSRNNDDPTSNALIHSPFHTLKINGVDVPVYTARCGKGSHSFAWVDITSAGDFALDVSLTVSEEVKVCVVLPESREVEPTVSGTTVSSTILDTGSFTYTFAKRKGLSYTSPTLMPLTIMVTRQNTYKSTYNNTVEIQPGVHGTDDLKFEKGYTNYVIKKGFHDISSISLPSNSVLYIEQGAYIQVTDRVENGQHNTDTALHADDVRNVKIISRGLLDCGKLQGGDGKYKHVVNVGRSSDVSIEGLTIINSNTWTVCAYSSSNVTITQNLLLSYRTYSDGIMMSECTNSRGTYNFVRTGDDGIEFKGTGWWGAEGKVGSNCVYEYNDLWTDKGAGYCLTWESACSMKNMVFRNNSVGFAQPTWTDRNTALDCLLGTNANSKWSDITFENIEIYCVLSPNAINLQVQGEGAILENITFKNITVASAGGGVHAVRMHFSANGGDIKNIKLQNVTFCGKLLTAEHKNNVTLFKNEAGDKFDNITVQ